MKKKWKEVYEKYATKENLSKHNANFINFPFSLNVVSPIDILTVSKDWKQAFIDTSYINNNWKIKKIKIKVI
jgi:hypothetical protein